MRAFRRTMWLTAAALLVCVLDCAAWAELSQEQLYSLFHQGNEAFGKANVTVDDPNQASQLYDSAILSYERIIRDGNIKNAKLFYNLANAYLLNEDVGRAILNYRRALKLDSDDVNIKKNLAFAQSRRVDKVSVEVKRRFLQTLFFWHYDFSLRMKLLASALSVGVLCITLTVVVWRGRSAPATTIVVLAAILAICLLGSAAVQARRDGRTAGGVVVAAEVIARQGDAQSYPPSFKEPLHAGTEFDLVEQRPGWLHIRLADGSDGWISDSAAELI